MSAFSNFLNDISGQRGNITVPRAYVKFCDNDHMAAILLNQIIYWRQRGTNGEFAKSYADWHEELMLTERQIKRATDALKRLDIGLTVTIKKSKYYGMRLTNHYTLNFDKFMKRLESYYFNQSTPLTKGGGYGNEMLGVNNNDYTSNLDNTNVLSPDGGFLTKTLQGSELSENAKGNQDDSQEPELNIQNFKAGQDQLRNNAGKRDNPIIIMPEKKTPTTIVSTAPLPSSETDLLNLISNDQQAATDFYMLSQGHVTSNDKLDALLNTLGWRIKSGLSKSKSNRSRIEAMIAHVKPLWVTIAKQRIQDFENQKRIAKQQRDDLFDYLTSPDEPFVYSAGQANGEIKQLQFGEFKASPVTADEMRLFVVWYRVECKGCSMPQGYKLQSWLKKYRNRETIQAQKPEKNMFV